MPQQCDTTTTWRNNVKEQHKKATWKQPLKLHVKTLCEFNDFQWSDNWKNVKGNNPNLLSWLPSLGLKLPMSLQYLEWH
jgi:hypothetical protein